LVQSREQSLQLRTVFVLQATLQLTQQVARLLRRAQPSAFEDYSSVDVDHYVVVNFQGFKRVINAMGGVEVDVEDEIPANAEIEDGLQTLNGNQALFYVRYRGTAGGDLDRIRRQQQFVAALRSQAFDWNTVERIPRNLRVANRNLLTDLDLRQGIFLGRVLLRRGPNAQMTAQQLQGDPKTLENGDQVLVPDDETNEEMLDEFR
jgi:anionic cell wall polymer biosynthesis LytR-Cps2A-Psr (LCP) family protein